MSTGTMSNRRPLIAFGLSALAWSGYAGAAFEPAWRAALISGATIAVVICLAFLIDFVLRWSPRP